MATLKRIDKLLVLNRILIHWNPFETVTASPVILPDRTTKDGTQDLAMSIQSVEAALMMVRNQLSMAQGARNKLSRAHPLCSWPHGRISLMSGDGSMPCLKTIPTLMGG
jgi:hypothetical protein